MNVCSDHGNLRTAQQKYLLFTNPSLPVILLMAEILHQLIGSLSHYLGFHTSQVVQDFSHQQYLLRLGLWGVLGHTFSEGMSRETFGTLHHWTPIIVYKCAYIYYIYIYNSPTIVFQFRNCPLQKIGLHFWVHDELQTSPSSSSRDRSKHHLPWPNRRTSLLSATVGTGGAMGCSCGTWDDVDGWNPAWLTSWGW